MHVITHLNIFSWCEYKAYVMIRYALELCENIKWFANWDFNDEWNYINAGMDIDCITQPLKWAAVFWVWNAFQLQLQPMRSNWIADSRYLADEIVEEKFRNKNGFLVLTRVAWDAVPMVSTKIVSMARVLPSHNYVSRPQWVNSTFPRQNGSHFADDISKWILMNETLCVLIRISPKFVSNGTIGNNPVLVYIIAWRRIGDKPLSEPMLTQFTDVYMWHQGERS